MNNEIVKFDEPPVVETVLGVQFEKLRGYATAHAGYFWKSRVGDEWTSIREVEALEDIFERFGDAHIWGPPPGIKIRAGSEPNRVQILRADEERMIQIQSTRFLYNWRKGQTEYPTYQSLLPEFRDVFGTFQQFILDARLGEIVPNQWEVTYLNHIPKDGLWESTLDWGNVFPGFYVPAAGLADQQFESFQGEWHSVIGDEQGRLHVSIRHGKLSAPNETEVIVLRMTARGPVDRGKSLDLISGFNTGHDAIVRTFAAMTSKTAHALWKRRA